MVPSQFIAGFPQLKSTRNVGSYHNFNGSWNFPFTNGLKQKYIYIEKYFMQIGVERSSKIRTIDSMQRTQHLNLSIGRHLQLLNFKVWRICETNCHHFLRGAVDGYNGWVIVRPARQSGTILRIVNQVYVKIYWHKNCLWR